MRGGVTSGHLTGALLFLAAAGCWAIYSVAARGALARIEPLRATTYATVVGAIMLTAIATPSFCRTEWTHVSFGVWLNVLFLSVGPTAIAYLFYFRGLRAVGPVTATLTMFAVPVSGATASFLFLGESLSLLQLVGAFIMIAGAFLAVADDRLRRDSRPRGSVGRAVRGRP